MELLKGFNQNSCGTALTKEYLDRAIEFIKNKPMRPSLFEVIRLRKNNGKTL